MLFVIAFVAFAAAFFEHWGKVMVAAPFDQTGLGWFGLACLALGMVWSPGVPRVSFRRRE